MSGHQKKIWSICLSIFFLGAAYAQVPVHINSGNPAFPFPQFSEYQYGKSLAKYNAQGVTHADMEKSIREAWQIMANRFYYTGQEAGGVQYIRGNDGCPYDCAEGEGYAMLAAAYMADQVTFNGLWMRVHDDMVTNAPRYNDGVITHPNYRYGKYIIKEESGDAAADGDWDIGLALLMATKQWGSRSGVMVNDGNGGTKEMNYLEEAYHIIADFADTTRIEPLGSPGVIEGYVTGHIGVDGYPKGGNTFGETTGWGYTQNRWPGIWPSREVFSNDDNQSGFASYTATAYYHSFAKFMEEEGATPWVIEQFKRVEASSNWLMEKSYEQGRLPFAGSFNVDGTSVVFTDVDPTQGKCDGESFRMPWRTILDYIWRGNQQLVWDPATHSYSAGSSDAMKKNADRLAEFLKVVGPLDASGNPTTPDCEQLGMSPDVGSPFWKGLPTLKQGYGGNGTMCTGRHWTNYTLGTSAPAAVAHGDEELIALLYRQLELKWDDEDPGVGDNPDERYINSVPKYFHGWFRLLGMLTLSGNLHAPEDMVAGANMKVYMEAKNKTFAFAGDEITYEVSYRNYGSLAASGVRITIPVSGQYTVTNTGGGTLSGNNLVFDVGTVSGFTTATGIDPTRGSYTFSVRVKNPAVEERICIQATITAANGSGWESNEYPNNATYTYQLNCVDILETRSLSIEKTAGAAEINPGDTLDFYVDFENSTSAGYLNGGRPGVNFSFTYSMYAGDYSLFSRFRNWHDAQEAYIDLGSYRASYYMWDNANNGVYDAATNPSGWKLIGKNMRTGEAGVLRFQGEPIPEGQDANGKWNQRIIMYFPNDISAPTHTLYSHLGNEFQLHKGQVEPIWYEVQMESTPSSQLPVRLQDDWSYAASVSTNNDKDLYHVITPNYAYGSENGTPVTTYGRFVCEPLPPGSFDGVLIEEWDGTTWRRVAGNGPLPGREMLNVTVVDTIPAGFEFVEFINQTVEGINATITTSNGYEIITWTMPVVLVGMKGQISYKVKAKGACPQTDKFYTNSAWIWSDTDSPVAASIEIRVTCDSIIPVAKPTTMTKVADKQQVDAGDEVTFSIEYVQTHGTISTPSLSDNSGWTTTYGNQPTFSAGRMVFPSGGPSLTVYDYAYGHDGYATFEIDRKGDNGFILAFRHLSGSPFDPNGVYAEVYPHMGAIRLRVYNGTSLIYEQGNFGLGTSDLKIKVKAAIHGDTLELYFTNTTGLPTVSITGVRDVQQGHFGIYNKGEYASNAHEISNITMAFDAAFNVKVVDPLPAGLRFFASADGSMVDAGNGIVESAVTLPGPVDYGTVLNYQFTAVVDECNSGGSFKNTAWMRLLTHGENAIGATTDLIHCGEAVCTKPAALSIAPADTIICEDGSVVLRATGDIKSGDIFAWYKEGPEAETLIQQAPNLTSLEVAEEGSYYVIINPAEPLCSLQSETVEVVVNSFVVPGEIGVDQLICENGTPDEIISLEDAAGGDQTSYTYSWQQSEDGSLWSDIAGAAQVSYTPSALTQKTIFRRVAASGVCPAVYSNEVTIELTEPLEAAVSIEGLPEICPGAEASFEAQPVNGGSTPVYTWYINGTEIEGETDSLLTISTLNDGDVLTVELHSSIACLLANSVISDGLTLVVDEIIPQLVIAQLTATSLCEGDDIAFEVTDVLGTGAPDDIRWYINGQFTGTTGMTFNSTELADQDAVYAEIISSLDCASPDPVQSNQVIVEVGTLSIPEVSISATSEEICTGDPVTFSVSSQSNEGTSPDYQWYINDAVVNGAASGQFTTSSLSDGDVVKVSMMSDAACLTLATAESNEIRVTVSSLLDPKVFIAIASANAGDLCEGEIVEFSITGTVAKGTDPEYQWYVNDLEVVGANDTTFSSRISQGDRIYVTMATNSSCASVPEAMSDEITINALPVEIPSVTITSSSSGTLCPDATATLTILSETAAGSSPAYQWLRNGVPIAGAVSSSYIAKEPGDYSLLITSSLRCVEDPEEESNSVSIQYSPEFEVTIVADKNEICSYETLILEAGVQPAVAIAGYEWKAGNNTVANSANNTYETSIAAAYTVIAVDENGCSATSDIFVVSSAVQDAVTISPAEEEVCEGGSVDLVSSVTNVSYIYTWLDNSASPIQGANGSTYRASAGTYSLVVNNGACLDTSNVAEITERVLGRPVITGENEPLCRSEGIRYYVQQPGTGSVYTWTVPAGATIASGAGSSEITVDFGEQSGLVTVVETIGGNCSSERGELAITLDKCNLRADFTVDNSSLCEGGKVIFTNASVGVSSNTQYSWNFGSGASPATASGAGPHEVIYSAGGVYSPTLTITDGIEDSEVKTNSIIVNRTPERPVINGPAIVCAYSNTEYAVDLAGQFEWTLVGGGTITGGINTRSITARFESAGAASIELTYTDPNGCVAEKAIQHITVEDAAPVELTASATTLCAGASSNIMLQGAAGSISWYRNGSLISGQHSSVLTVSEGGEYSARISGACEQNTDVIQISLIEFSISAGDDMLVDEGHSVQIHAETSHPAVEYTWIPMLPKVANPVFTPTETTVYSVTATDANGCEARDEIKITVVRPLFIPNAFTPNGDGVHDVWEITGLERYGNDVIVRIFNRWGNIVYEDKGYAFRWDGTKNGTAMPVATYYYVVELPGDAKPLTGYILLSK